MVFIEEGQLQMNRAQYDPVLDVGDPRSALPQTVSLFLFFIAQYYDETYLISR